MHGEIRALTLGRRWIGPSSTQSYVEMYALVYKIYDIRDNIYFMYIAYALYHIKLRYVRYVVTL